jgi:hypothetical protein
VSRFFSFHFPIEVVVGGGGLVFECEKVLFSPLFVFLVRSIKHQWMDYLIALFTTSCIPRFSQTWVSKRFNKKKMI